MKCVYDILSLIRSLDFSRMNNIHVIMGTRETEREREKVRVILIDKLKIRLGSLFIVRCSRTISRKRCSKYYPIHGYIDKLYAYSLHANYIYMDIDIQFGTVIRNCIEHCVNKRFA